MGLKEYVVTRVLATIPTVLILLTFIFFAIRIIPGDPAAAMVGEDAPEEFVAEVRRRLGLDKPLPVQYVEYISGVLRGDLGKSIVLYRTVDVSSIIWQRAGVTIQLAVIAWILSVCFGLTFGIYSALKEDKPQDHALRLVTLFLYAIPVFVLGIFAQLIFGAYLKVLPIQGTHSAFVVPPGITGLILLDTLLVGDFRGFFDALSHFILPSIILATHYLALTSRLTRSETIKAMKRMYCLVAEAKGLDNKTVVFKHAFRNALLPVITLISMQAGSLLTGSVIVETIFSLGGLGSLLYYAASERAYMQIQGLVTVFALILAAIGLVIDISYYLLDPRIR